MAGDKDIYKNNNSVSLSVVEQTKEKRVSAKHEEQITDSYSLLERIRFFQLSDILGKWKLF